jgi:hypothetical protein
VVDTGIGTVAKMRRKLQEGRKEEALKSYVEAKAIIFLVFLSLLAGCAKTQLCGSVYTSDKEPVKGLKVQVKAEPGSKSTWVKEDGSFCLKGLKPNTAYDIIAICETDNTRARADNVHVNKGNNTVPDNKMLILAIPIPTKAHEDTSEDIKEGPGRTVPEKP